MQTKKPGRRGRIGETRGRFKAPLAELVVAGRRLMAAEPLRGRTDTLILLRSGLKRARSYTNPRNDGTGLES
jgi:hypothetical protein